MDTFIGFFNSNFFIALITLLVGTAAFVIYKLQQRDTKRDAASIVLMEIKNAERNLKKIRANIDQNTLAPDIFLMPSESWTKYKYLFVRDFDRDEWDAIAEFYNKCQLIDDDVKYNNAAFWADVEEIRSNKQRILADYAYKYEEKIKLAKTDEKKSALTEEFNKKTSNFDVLYMGRQGDFGYAPNKPVNDARLHVQGLPTNLSQTAVGIKLKKMSKVKLSS